MVIFSMGGLSSNSIFGKLNKGRFSCERAKPTFFCSL